MTRAGWRAVDSMPVGHQHFSGNTDQPTHLMWWILSKIRRKEGSVASETLR